MKIIGLIGGMSWESTAHYYSQINELVKQQCGGLHSARIVLYSVDFHDIESLLRAGKWDEIGAVLGNAAQALEKAGAEFLLLCTNTMHKVVPTIEAAVKIPLLHIADPTAEAIKQAGIRTIGLLGTRFTMEQDFYRDHLALQHGLQVLVPNETECEIVNDVIFNELCLGEIKDSSRNEYRKIIAGLIERGAEGIILGCTEIAMLIAPADSPVPVFDTTNLHAMSAVALSLA